MRTIFTHIVIHSLVEIPESYTTTQRPDDAAAPFSLFAAFSCVVFRDICLILLAIGV